MEGPRVPSHQRVCSGSDMNVQVNRMLQVLVPKGSSRGSRQPSVAVTESTQGGGLGAQIT